MRLARGIVCLLVLIAACSGSREPDSPVAGVKRSESELKRYITWQHDWKALAFRHRAEREAETQKLRSEISPGSNGMAQESVLVAFTNRQEQEMARFWERAPKGPTATALRATLAGIGVITGDSRGMTYTPHHDEAVLDRARAQYGDKWVRWVLEHEATINSTIGANQ